MNKQVEDINWFAVASTVLSFIGCAIIIYFVSIPNGGLDNGYRLLFLFLLSLISVLCGIAGHIIAKVKDRQFIYTGFAYSGIVISGILLIFCCWILLAILGGQ